MLLLGALAAAMPLIADEATERRLGEIASESGDFKNAEVYFTNALTFAENSRDAEAWAADALRFVFCHLIAGLGLLEIGFSLLHLLGIFLGAEAEKGLAFGNFLSLINQNLLDEAFDFRLDFDKLDSLDISDIRLRDINRCRL